MNKQYVLTDGKNYISYAGCGITVVGNIIKSKQFTFEKANNVLKGLPKSFRKFNFKVVEYNEDKTIEPVKRDEVFEKMQEDDIEFAGIMDNLLDKMMNFEDYIKNLKDYDRYICAQFEVLKRALRDAEHKLEIEDLDMYSSWKVGKDIQAIQRRRRKLKNDQDKIKYILEHNFVDCTTNMISNYIKERESNEPTYMARYLDYLFEN
jgi:hypothetical protein